MKCPKEHPIHVNKLYDLSSFRRNDISNNLISQALNLNQSSEREKNWVGSKKF